jgi:hypothetical protein
MRVLMTQFDDHWVELTGLGGKLLTTVRYGIKDTYRKFEPNSQHWLIHWSYLSFVVHIARSYGVEVEYTELPTKWQLAAAGATVIADSSALADENPFARLFVTEDAPLDVIHASYRALAKRHHPDVGGLTEKFQEIESAYRKILRLRGQPT